MRTMKTLSVISLLLVFFSQDISAATSEELLNQGNKHLVSHNYSKAVKIFERAAALNSADARIFKGLGIAYFHLGDNGISSDVEIIGKAVQALLTAVNLNPDDPESFYYLGVAYLALNDKENAVKTHSRLKLLNLVMAEALASKIASYEPQGKYYMIPNPEADKQDAIQYSIRKKALELEKQKEREFIEKLMREQQEELKRRAERARREQEERDRLRDKYEIEERLDRLERDIRSK